MLKIIDGRQGPEAMPVVKSRAFQLTSKEARVAPDVVTGTYLLVISLFILFITYVYVFCYRIAPGEWYIFSGII